MSNDPTNDNKAEDGHQSPSRPYNVGYCRPPKHTQWRKGVCGNPSRIRKRHPKPIATLIDEFFAGTIEIVRDGDVCRVTRLEAILRQLAHQAVLGKKGALDAFLLYQAFVSKRCGMRDKPMTRFLFTSNVDEKVDHDWRCV